MVERRSRLWLWRRPAGSDASISLREVDKEIVRDLKVSRNTVRKVLRRGETSLSYQLAVSRVRSLAIGRRSWTGCRRRTTELLHANG
jgi:hypothetical protein